jgi:sulfite exporter TauE/SafE
MMDGTLISVLALGLILGLRHALDPDHVVAVSNIVSESKSVRRSSLVGTFWGLGHTTSLLSVGFLVIGLKVQISDRMTLWMEFAIALMLVGLGLKTISKSLRGWKLHIHRHTHDGSSHIHVHLHDTGAEELHHHRHLLKSGTRPFVVGLVHGMAGSATLMILVLATIPSAVAGLVYVAIFGLGSVGGMLLMSSLISLPFALTRKKRFTLLGQGLQVMVGLFSLAFGLVLVWQYGFREHLLF